MALKGCIAKAGKALDSDDRNYLIDRLENTTESEEKVLENLKGLVLSEQNDAIKLIEAKGVKVERAGSLLGENKTSSQGTASEAAVEGEKVLISSKTEPAVSKTGRKESKSSAKPSSQATSPEASDSSPTANTKGQGSTQVEQRSGEGEADSRQAPGKGTLKAGFSSNDPAVIRKIQSKKRPGGLYLTRESFSEAIKKLSEASDIIAHFMGDKRSGLFLDAFTDSYMAGEDVVNLTGTDIAFEGPDGKPLDLNDPADFKKQKEILEHEIVHVNTAAYLAKHLTEQNEVGPMRDIRYLHLAAKGLANILTMDLSDDAKARASYILTRGTPAEMVAEFVAVMGAETAVAEEIYAALTPRGGISANTLKGRIKAFMQKVSTWFDALTDKDLESALDIEKVHGALARTLDQGLEFREQQYQEAQRYTQGVELGVAPKTPAEYTKKASFDYLNYAVSSMLNSRLERKGQQMLGNLHRILSERFPLYVDAANKAVGIYDSSPALQQFLHTVTGEGVDKVKKANVLSKFAEINAQRTEIINDQMAQIRVLSKDLKPQELADLDIITSQLPLHDYFVLAGDLSTAESIDAEAELLRKELWKINARAVRDVDQLVDWNIDENQTGKLYNLDASPAMQGAKDSDFALKLRKLLALESIKRFGSEKFEKLLGHEELMQVIKDNSVANALSTLDNEGTSNVRDSLVMDYWKESFRIKAVTKADFKMYEYGEDTGWKILKAPTKTELGIVYKPVIDSTDIAGAYTDTKLSSTDVDVPQTMKRYPGVVETKNGHKLLLTKEQKRELGLLEEFGQGLVRSTAHSVSIKESQIIRDELLKEDTHLTIGKGKSIDKLESIIESENIDNPWFIKLEEGTEYSKLPAAIRAKYMPVGKRASNVKNFNENVDLVRKDISHWLLGGSTKSLFENPKLKWATRILKNLITGAKIRMVVLNPVKIANDNLSNLTYLGVLGLSPAFIASNYKAISTDFAEYTDLQRQIFQAKLQLVSRPESAKIKKHLNALQKRLKANSVGDIGDKGFINSLGSDLVSRSADTLSGFQADMHTALEYLLHEKAGNKNIVSHFIMQLQKTGFQAEDFFKYLGGIAGQAKSTKLIQQELDQVSDRLREIKSEEDIVNYVSQFTTSPSSEAVRVGSAMTDLTDVLAKETLYRHFVENQRMSAEDARIKVLDSFPDYKENMPLAIKQLSDAGIIMFPSFWLRIQKIIYRMARDKPVNLATELMVQEALGTNVNTIFEANLINKANTFGGLLHSPFEAAGFGSVTPLDIF